MLLLPCEYAGRTAACRLEAIWGELYRSSRMVTGEARWSTSAPEVVRVVSPGVLQAVSPGEAEVRAAFNDRELVSTFRVLDTGPPWYVLRGPSVEFHVQTVDQNGAALDGVLVEIIAGAEAGKQAVSERGRAIFKGESVCGPITVRGTKPGYQTWEGSAIKCGRAGNGNWGSETVGPVRMGPVT
jgi:hypothetical protein